MRQRWWGGGKLPSINNLASSGMNGRSGCDSTHKALVPWDGLAVLLPFVEIESDINVDVVDHIINSEPIAAEIIEMGNG